MQLMFFGAPGVGKGTQAKIISAKLKIPHISTGDILRSAVKEKTPLGIKAQEIMNRGELVPDDLMIGLIKETLKEKRCEKGFILDGYPRTVNQAIAFSKLLNELQKADVILVAIEANNEEIIRRLSQRRECKVCHNIFNLNDISNLNKCPSCHSENSFYQRSDDKEDVIRNRLKVYDENTKPVLDFYKNKGKIIKVNGLGSIEEVTRKIISNLEKMKV